MISLKILTTGSEMRLLYFNGFCREGTTARLLVGELKTSPGFGTHGRRLRWSVCRNGKRWLLEAEIGFWYTMKSNAILFIAIEDQGQSMDCLSQRSHQYIGLLPTHILFIVTPWLIQWWSCANRVYHPHMSLEIFIGHPPISKVLKSDFLVLKSA